MLFSCLNAVIDLLLFGVWLIAGSVLRHINKF